MLLDAEIATLIGNTNAIKSEAQLIGVAQLLVNRAAELGVVLTIEQRPLHPLAMGHFETVVATRQSRRPL